MFFIYTTVSSQAEAKSIIRDLLSQGMIACANVFAPVISFFFWEGELSESEEVVVIMKVKESQRGSVMERIKELHSYEFPSIAAWKADKVDKDFLKWVETSEKVHY